MNRYHVTFRHIHWDHPTAQFVMARNPLAAIARSARSLGLHCRRVNGTWQAWHTDNGVQCYRVADVSRF